MELNNRFILTLAYTAQFGFPLTKDEIDRRLLSKKAVDFLVNEHDFPSKIQGESRSERRCPGVNGKVRGKVDSKKDKIIEIVEKNGFFTLKGHEESFARRKKTENNFAKRKDEVIELSQVLRKIPWIKAVAITGAFAMHNSAEMDDDIDLFVITQKNRLWIARVAVLILAWKRGKKGLFGFEYKSKDKKNVDKQGLRYKNKDKSRIKDDWCFNLWFDESALSIPEERRDIYTAYEICQTMWVVDDNSSISRRFFLENKWVRDYLPEFWDWCVNSERDGNIGEYEYKNQDESGFNTTGSLEKSSMNNREDGLRVISFVLNIANSFAFFIQKTYLRMRLNINSQNMTANQAFLHLGSLRTDVYKKWRELIE